MCDSKPFIARSVGFDAHFLTRCEHNCLVVFCSDLPLKERNYSCEQQLSPVHWSSDNLRNSNTGSHRLWSLLQQSSFRKFRPGLPAQ